MDGAHEDLRALGRLTSGVTGPSSRKLGASLRPGAGTAASTDVVGSGAFLRFSGGLPRQGESAQADRLRLPPRQRSSAIDAL